MTNDIRVLPMRCPRCECDLRGLRYDELFGCRKCLVALHPRNREISFPIRIASHPADGPIPDLHMPFWRLRVSVQAVAANKEQHATLKTTGKINSLWVTAFQIGRSSYFGDTGLIFTERQIDPEQRGQFEDQPPLLGITRHPDLALRIGRLYLLSMIDKRADVTELKLDIELKSCELWGIPYREDGDHLVDLLAGSRIPAFSFDDLTEMKALLSKLNT